MYSDRDPRRLRTLYEIEETHYRGLVAIGVEECTYSSIVAPSILEKLPDTLRLTITRGEEYLEWNLGDLLSVLLKEVELREDYSLTPQVHPTPEGYGRENLPPQNELILTTVFVDTRLWKTKHPQKRFQNFPQSYMLSTDWIEIHQSQPTTCSMT